MEKMYKTKLTFNFFAFGKFLMLVIFLNAFKTNAQISFTGGTYTQDFNTLAISGTTNNLTIPGWLLTETGGGARDNEQYAFDNGGSNTGDMYSYGATSISERALGSLRSGTLIPVFGAFFTNNTGATLTSFTISYTGEQWRLGTAARTDQLDFQYSLDATSLATGTWTDVNALDFITPNTVTTGAKDGNIAANQATLTSTITGLSIPDGAIFYIRWTDADASGADDGLSIDNFSLSGSTSETTFVTITAQDANAAETGSDPGTFRISRTGATTDALTVSYNISGSATSVDYTPTLTGTAIVAIGQSFTDITITPVDDADQEGNQTLILTITDAVDYDPGVPATATVTIADNDVPVVFTRIHTIQGNVTTQLPNITGSGAHNDRSPLEGQTVTIQGVVTAVYDDLNAFFVQEQDVNADADPATSEGIFVFTAADPTVSEGDLVTVTGAVDEFFGMTQIDNDNASLSITINSSGNTLPNFALINLPIAANQDIDDFYEQYEGMRVRFQDKMVVSEYFELSRYGQIVLTESSRPFQYTHSDNSPTSIEYTAFQSDLARRTIILDDENNIENAPLTLPAPNNVFFYPQPNGFGTGVQGTNYFRGGDAVNNLTGVLHWSFAGFTGTDAWRIRPTQATPVEFTTENIRPAAHTTVGGNIKVAGFNVLNYFTSIDNGGAIAGPTGNLQEGRGADSQNELTRQTQKLIQALESINADVFGLTELENNTGNAGANGGAIKAVVDALNAEVGVGTYDFINVGNVGTDAITVGVIYKTTVVSPVGNAVILNSASFTDPNNTGTQRNRPAVAASFQVINTGNPDFGAVFTVAVNHLKSKGAGGATGLDADQGDGQSSWNDTRAKAATALAAWLATDPTGSNDPDFLIIGDLNAYKGETPITNLKNAGYTDLVETFGGSNAYSYVFDGQLGYLDHALSNTTLTAQVTGTTEWHINGDEVSVFDYNNTIDDGAGEQSFEAKPTGNNLFEANAFRTSDHDPVIVGLDLTTSSVPVMVSITSQDAAAAETGSDAGTFRISRTGPANDALTVNYTIATGTGQAINGTDYTPNLTGTAIIPIGQSFVDIVIMPVTDAINEGDETVVLALVDDPTYDLDASSTATVTIADGCTMTLITSSTSTTSCTGTNDGTASVIVASGGTAPYTYSWTNNIPAGTASIVASKDNSIYEESTGNSNGAGDSFVAGTTAAGFINRTLIAFDIAGNIPAGASIINASLQLSLTHTSGISGPKTHSLHKLAQDWGEGTSNAGSNPGRGATATTNDATWLRNFFPSSDWTNSGGTFNALSSAGTVVDQPGLYTWSSPAMRADVQSWLDNPAAGFGWLLKSDETGNRQAKRYASKESITPADRPLLTVTYGPAVIGTTSSVSNLAPGTYTVTVTDANGCIATANVTIVGPTTLPSIISEDYVCTSNNTYLITGKVYVKDGATLFIDEGVVFKATPSATPEQASALIITRTGRIEATGSAEEPIVFTTCIANPVKGTGYWGGVMLLGNAPINQPADQQIEGISLPSLPPGVDISYGGGGAGLGNADENQGTLNYVRIEYAGAAIASDNELNSLTCAGVGRGTFIDFVQAVYGADDAFEFFGGTVNAKHLIALAPDDDAFDFDFGYSGNIQFVISVLNPGKATYSANSNGIESDNDGIGTAATPRTKATISNMTVIGLETLDLAGPVESGGKGLLQGAHFRRNSSYVVRNSVYMGFPTGVRFESAGTIADAANFQYNVVHGFTATDLGAAINGTNTEIQGDVEFSNATVDLTDPFNETFPDFRPSPTSPAATGANFSGLTGLPANFFQPTTYRGAFSINTIWNNTWARFF